MWGAGIDTDCRALEAAIRNATSSGVAEDEIETARYALAEARREQGERDEAAAELEALVQGYTLGFPAESLELAIEAASEARRTGCNLALSKGHISPASEGVGLLRAHVA